MLTGPLYRWPLRSVPALWGRGSSAENVATVRFKWYYDFHAHGP